MIPRHRRQECCRLKYQGDSVAAQASTDERQGKREVRTRDGASLAVWTDGAGPPVVLVHGSLGDHTGFAALVGELKGDFETFAMDRRGFGATPDTEPYSIVREFEDVATVVDTVAAESGNPVTLVGHSFGANCAMGAASLSTNVAHLVLYEPSFGLVAPVHSIERVEAELAAGNREGAVMLVLVDTLEMTPDEVEALRATPRWPILLAGAPTMPREARAESAWVYTPGVFDAITAPTLMLVGSESPPSFLAATVSAAAAIPDAVIRVLPGQGHLAHRTEPGMVAGLIGRFVGRTGD